MSNVSIEPAVDYELEVSSIVLDHSGSLGDSTAFEESDKNSSPCSSSMIDSSDGAPASKSHAVRTRTSTPSKAVKPVIKPYAVINKKLRHIKAFLGHWDGGSSSKPRVVLDRAKKCPVIGAISVGGPDSFLASGGYYDPYLHVHHQKFDNIIGKTTNGIRSGSPRYSYQNMYRWFFVHFEDVDSPDLADWSQWVRYDMLYDSVDDLVHYYSTSPLDYTKTWEKMVNHKRIKRKRNNW